MFDTLQPGRVPGDQVPVPDPDPDPDLDRLVPLERLEAQICELAGHLTAATCRFLLLLADFDARRGWEAWDMTSCARWLSWKCQMGSGAAREHVRVARALPGLPVIRGEFAAGRMSYAKVRALTRIATPDTEADLAEIAVGMTGNQLERFARAHRQVSQADDVQARMLRRLSWRFDEDGCLSGTFRLPPLDGAVLLQALRAAAGDLEHPHEAASRTSSSLADALAAMAEAYLGGKVAGADNPDVYQVIVHVGTGARDVSAETPETPETPDHPADPSRCHVEDGPAVSVATGDMLTCTATLSWMLHDHDGTLLDVGRRRRKPTAALRRAVRERDGYRCRYPGCESRRVDLHHVRYWRNGGETKLANLISLCRRHHTQVHEHGYLIAAAAGGGFTFFNPDGNPVPASPALPGTTGSIEDCHDAEIGPDTIVPAWYGERLDLDYAIAVCFANAETQIRQASQPPAADWRPQINYAYTPDLRDELQATPVLCWARGPDI